MNNNVSDMTRLPMEVLLETSAYLSPEDLIRCAAVSQAWYAVFIRTIADWHGRQLIEHVRYWRFDSVELVASRMSGFAVLFIQNIEYHPATHILIRGLAYSNWRQLEGYAVADQFDAIEHLSAVDPECLPMAALTNLFVHSRQLRHFTLSIHGDFRGGFVFRERGPHVVFSWVEGEVSTFLTHLTLSLSPSCLNSAARLELIAEELVLASPSLVYLDVDFASVLHRHCFSLFLVPPSRSLRTCLFTPLDTREYLIHSQKREEQSTGTVLGYSLPSAPFRIRPWTTLLLSYACTLTRLYLEGRNVWYGLAVHEFPLLEELMLRVKRTIEEDDSSMDIEFLADGSDDSIDESDGRDGTDDDSQAMPSRILAGFLVHLPQLHTFIIRSDKTDLSLYDIHITDYVLETLSKHCRKLDYLCVSGGSLGWYSSDGLYRFARDSGRRLRVLELDCTGPLNQGRLRQHIDLGNLILMAKHLRYFELRHECTRRRRCRLYGQCPSIFSGRPGCKYFEKTRENSYSAWPFTPRIPVDRLFVSPTLVA